MQSNISVLVEYAVLYSIVLSKRLLRCVVSVSDIQEDLQHLISASIQ